MVAREAGAERAEGDGSPGSGADDAVDACAHVRGYAFQFEGSDEGVDGACGSAGAGHRGGLPALPQGAAARRAWKPEQWLPADAQPTSAEVTLAQLRMPALTIADIEQVEADSLKYRYE